jgi:hypothetical protein
LQTTTAATMSDGDSPPVVLDEIESKLDDSGSESEEEPKEGNEWADDHPRKCHDIAMTIVFVLFWCGLIGVAGTREIQSNRIPNVVPLR